MSFSPALWDVSIPRVSHLSEERLPECDSFRLILTGKRSDAPQNDVPRLRFDNHVSDSVDRQERETFSLFPLCMNYAFHIGP